MLLITTNDNTGRGWVWNRSTTSGNPSGIHLVEVDRNGEQSGTPHGVNQSESASSGHNLTSAGNPSGTNLSNGLPMLGNPNSAKQPNTAKKGYNQTPTAIVMNKNVPTVHLQIRI